MASADDIVRFSVLASFCLPLQQVAKAWQQVVKAWQQHPTGP